MTQLQEWIYRLLVDMGLMSERASYLDNAVILGLIVAVTVAIDYFCRYLVLGSMKRLARKTKNQLDDLIIDRKIIHKMMHMIPAVLVYILLPFAFPADETPLTLSILQKLCLLYIIAVSLRFISASLTLVLDIYNQKDSFKNKPLKGFIQILQVTAYFIGAVLIIAVLIDKSPVSLFAGLGASAAILMLVFKDTLLGFVAGIQLSANDMLRAGDWITMSKYGANGTVLEMNLTAVKVRNFDNTITTIPSYALVSDAFQNWRGMSESGGRRIKRSLSIDMHSIHFCTPELLSRLRKIALLTDYIDTRNEEIRQYNEARDFDRSIPVNGKQLTNLGLFRAYIVRYLRSLPEINNDLVCLVRHLQPAETGIPIEIYCFSSNKVWAEYEAIQARIFEHILAAIPEFELSVFQNVSGEDLWKREFQIPEKTVLPL